jgi:RNA polymerase sigma-70 factor (ECF subfamily)
MGTNADRLPDEVLLAELGTGEAEFTVAFVHRFQRVVFGVAMTITGDPGTAEDVAQRAFQQASRDAGGYDSRGGLVRAWLATIARDLAVDVIRSRSATPAIPDDVAGLLTAMSGTPERVAVAPEGATVLRGMLACLPATQARAVAMASTYGMTAREIADAENIPLGTARTRIRDGMRKLRDAHLPEDAGR